MTTDTTIFHPPAAYRRLLLLMMIGALLVWAGAIWSLRSTLAAASAGGVASMEPAELIPALLLFGVVFAVPLVLWSLLADYAAEFALSATGLHYRTLGTAFELAYEQIQQIEPAGPAEAPGHRLVFSGEPQGRISPLARLLNRAQFGPGWLRIPEGMDELLHALQPVS